MFDAPIIGTKPVVDTPEHRLAATPPVNLVMAITEVSPDRVEARQVIFANRVLLLP